MILNTLYNSLTNLPLAAVLSHYGCTLAAIQDDKTVFLAGSPFVSAHSSDDSTAFSFSRGLNRGGIYCGIYWECKKTHRHGYGAFSLIHAIEHGTSNHIRDIFQQQKEEKQVLRVFVSILTEMTAGDYAGDAEYLQLLTATATILKTENSQGRRSFVPAQNDFTFELMDDFTPEALTLIGCHIKRIYDYLGRRKRVAKTHPNPPVEGGGSDTQSDSDASQSDSNKDTLPNGRDGEGLFLYSFGGGYARHHADKSNFDTRRIHNDFHFYQLKSYTTPAHYQGDEVYSEKVEATPTYPIFAFIYGTSDHLKDTDSLPNGRAGEGLLWGTIIQPFYENTPELKGHFKDSKGTEISFYNNGLTAFDVNTPLVGDATFLDVMTEGYTPIESIRLHQTGEYYERDHKTINEEGQEVYVDYDDDEIRASHLILVDSGIAAISAYYHLNTCYQNYDYDLDINHTFFHVCWQTDPRQPFTDFMWSLVRKFAWNRYTCLGTAPRQIEQMHRLCSKFSSLNLTTLPLSMQQQGLYSVPDFFRYYEMSENESASYNDDLAFRLFKCVMSSLPADPLVRVARTDKKTGKELDYSYKLDSACAWPFMGTLGYGREVNDETSDKIGRFIHVNGPFVEELDVKSVLAKMVECLTALAESKAKNSSDFRKMSNAIIDAKNLQEKSAANLPVRKVDYESGYGAELDHLYFQNGALEITPTTIRMRRYSELTFNVDKAEIMPWEFHFPCNPNNPPFTYGENPEYAERQKTLAEHKKDIKNYSVRDCELEENDLDQWARSHRWTFDFKGERKDLWKPVQVLIGFANEKFEKENELIREGKEFDADDQLELYGHFANIFQSLGRPLWRYKGGGYNYMPYIMENSVTSEGQAEGGSGKSIFVNVFMGCAGKVLKIDGRNLKLENDMPLQLANYIHHCHRIIHWEDWPQFLPISPLYNYVTSGFTFRDYHKKATVVPLKSSPGHACTSNYPPKGNDSSTARRLNPVGFSHRFRGADAVKNKLARKISDVMPELREEPEDMCAEIRNQIIFLDAMAMQFCMRHPEPINPPMGDMQKRQRDMVYGQRFNEYITEFFESEWHFNVPIDVKTIFTEYINSCETSDNKKDLFQLSTFKDKIRKYCEEVSIIVNPNACYSPEILRRKKQSTKSRTLAIRCKTWVLHEYFKDTKIWSGVPYKAVRILEKSDDCFYFSRPSDVPKSYNDFVKQREEYYKRPDQDIILDADNNPVTLTPEEQTMWDNYQSSIRRQRGPQAKPAEVEEQPETKNEEVSDDNLPF